ncbi:hypothetical protein RFI_16241 [Reticulomyxa filosa]|uniref:Uncharacterized protein n=1 Tax=Reticulomyxa filosa TaxID=46433 RepID=X6N4X7_RETFI|nr:hypothetical protein RFI_16241 [Reticulomyxa filosa]|eukprot:ETO20963.1 hypothetical protein RFI_16241 [Reticulomyxa filosa]
MKTCHYSQYFSISLIQIVIRKSQNYRMACSVFSDFAITVQLFVGISVVFVLVFEYIVERLRNERHRTIVQFWRKQNKKNLAIMGRLGCGALISHIFNVMVATMINTKGEGNVDECALYTVAFYYELTGVTIVQMMQYGLIKYSRFKYLQLRRENNGIDTPWGKRWMWVSYPGYYADDMDSSDIQQEILSAVCGHILCVYVVCFFIKKKKRGGEVVEQKKKKKRFN